MTHFKSISTLFSIFWVLRIKFWHFLYYAGNYFIIKKSTFDYVSMVWSSQFHCHEKKISNHFSVHTKGNLTVGISKKKLKMAHILESLIMSRISKLQIMLCRYIGTYMCVRPSQHLEYLYPPSGNPVKVYLIAKSFVSL